jgi:hypothetical protein
MVICLLFLLELCAGVTEVKLDGDINAILALFDLDPP